MSSYFSPKIEKRKSQKGGGGLFAREKISTGEVVIDFSTGSGSIIPMRDMDNLYSRGFDYGIQVGENEVFAATDDQELEDADFLNHSCDPNCGIGGSLKIVAMRDIEAGEEITFDYAMSESSHYEMPCRCGDKICRSVITGEDWKRSDLQKRYKGYFSDYLAKKIGDLQWGS